MTATDTLLSQHACHTEALLSKLRTSTYGGRKFSPTSFNTAIAMNSPFASPPPPYTPEHPHVILDHEKIPQQGAPPPPHPDVDPAGAAAAHTTSAFRGSSPKPLGMWADDSDIFHLPATTALTLLSRSIELLVSMTGDVPPTPPPSDPTTPEMQEELHHTAVDRDPSTGFCFGKPMSEDLDGVLIKHKQDFGDDSDDDFLSNGGEIKIIGAGAKGIYQNASITRKFWSKAAPEIPIEDYLFRFVFPSFFLFKKKNKKKTDFFLFHPTPITISHVAQNANISF